MALHLTTARSRRYPVEDNTDADYADDKALLANTPTQVDPPRHQTGRDFGFYISADNSKYICFNKKRHISTLNDGSPVLVDKFTDLSRSVSFTEIDINMRLAKALSAINSISILLTYRIK